MERALRLLHLSHNDGGSGAGRAAYRIHRMCLELGLDSRMVVSRTITGDHTVRPIGTPLRNRTAGALERKLKSLFPGERQDEFYPGLVNSLTSVTMIEEIDQADAVILYWVANGFFDVSVLPTLNKPVFWRLSDMWPVTGGCHYPTECREYKVNCRECPVSSSKLGIHLPNLAWKRKSRAYAKSDITFLTPSRWAYQGVKQSALGAGHRVDMARTGVDRSIYQPMSKEIGRRTYRLPLDRKIILFGALNAMSDPRKGHDLILRTLQHLEASLSSEELSQYHLCIFGGGPQPPKGLELPLSASFIPKLNDDVALAVLMSSADVMLFPAREDNLPQGVLEAMSCGVPTIAFDIGGMSDIVHHKNTGWLADPYDVTQLAKGIVWVLEDEERLATLSQSAAQLIAKHHDLRAQTEELVQLIQRNCSRGWQKGVGLDSRL